MKLRQIRKSKPKPRAYTIGWYRLKPDQNYEWVQETISTQSQRGRLAETFRRWCRPA